MNISEMPNPYEFSKPVTRLERFAGRRAELADIRYYLQHARHVDQPVNLALVGERAAGKTSLLNVIDHEARRLGLLTVRINLNSADAEPIRFFWKVYESIIDTMCEAGLIFPPGSDEDRTYRSIIDGLNADADHPNFPLRFPSHFAASMKGGQQVSESKLIRDLRFLHATTSRTCVLLFDECNVLGQNRVTLEMLRNVFMNLPGYLLVLTGTPTMFPLFDDVFSPIIRQFKKIPVQAFKSIEDTSSCIKAPLLQLGLDLRQVMPMEWKVQEDVHRLSAGRPYEVQLLCHFMFRRVQEKRMKTMDLTANVIDDVLRELEISASHTDGSRPVISGVRSLDDRDLEALGILAQCSGQADLDELLFISQLSYSNPEFSRQELSRSLEILVERGVLGIGNDGRISFLGDEFDSVYVSYFAESRDLAARVESQSVPDQLAATLLLHIAALKITDELDWPIGSTGDKVRVDEIIHSLLSGTVQDRDELEFVYSWIVQSIPLGKLVLGKFSVSYGPHRVVAWTRCPEVLPPNAKESIEALKQRGGALGGQLTLEQIHFTLPSEDKFFETILKTPNPELLVRLGSQHTRAAANSYLGGEIEKARYGAKWAARLPQIADGLNSLGYIEFSAGDIGEGRRFFKEALSKSDSASRDRALVAYNLAVCDLAEASYTKALEHLRSAREALASGKINRYELGCLFVIESANGTLRLIERDGPELLTSIEQAIAVLESSSLDSLGPLKIVPLSRDSSGGK
jgi:tetratricopeptide (TPR) repeat protein